MTGLLFSIKRYSVHDGPGIRVTFFMKGCPLSCLWCHNPEGISPEPQTILQTKRVGDREFTENETAGAYYSVEEIVDLLEKERIFFRQSKGGATFSGGEPMMQYGFLTEVLKACRDNGFHTAVDTSGYAAVEHFLEVIPHADLFLFDIKHLDERKHLEYTGVSNDLILSNLRLILDSGKKVMLRIPVVSGLNDDPEHLSDLRDFIADIKCENLLRVNLLPFHRIGIAKYRKFDIQYRMVETAQPAGERMNELKGFFEKTGVRIKVGG